MQRAVRIFLAIISILLVFILYKTQKTHEQIEEETAWLASLPKTINLHSAAFENGGIMPDDYAFKGANTSPPLAWDSVPEETKSLAITVTDYDAPSPKLKMMVISHWALYNISRHQHTIPRSISTAQLDSMNITVLKNYAGNNTYTGPRPLLGTHEYVFRIYALDFNSLFIKNATREELIKALKGHVLAYGELTGKF